MVYLAPPQLASASRPSYGDAYTSILATHRRSPLTSASSVILLVAPDVDALCAAKMLEELLKQDDVMHRTIPVSGVAELEAVKDELATYNEVCNTVHLFFLLTPRSCILSFSSIWVPFSISLLPPGLGNSVHI